MLADLIPVGPQLNRTKAMFKGAHEFLVPRPRSTERRSPMQKSTLPMTELGRGSARLIKLSRSPKSEEDEDGFTVLLSLMYALETLALRRRGERAIGIAQQGTKLA